MKNCIFLISLFATNLAFAAKKTSCNWEKDFWNNGGIEVIWGIALIFATVWGIKQMMKIFENL
jgi:hypothetical protein